MANAMKKMTPARKSKAEPRITVAKTMRPMGVSDMMSREPKSKLSMRDQMMRIERKSTPRGTSHKTGTF